ncbi:MAG: glutathione peroxidase [Streptococcaceae bacterium]|jgi:glutathione peroxidase|nr:glutathione peroxidase [Streptococcaceae bacterium]
MNFYDFSAVKMNGEEVPMSAYKGKVVLVVNTASKCGFTPQFEGLEELYKTYSSHNFEILGFPCNQFAHQDAGTNSEIAEFCQLNYGVTFPMFQKIDVNGSNAHPLYKWLKSQKSGLLGGTIKWNFTKFLVSADGDVLARFAPNVEPAEIESEIKKLVGE